jgi:hypothetical protein
VRAEVHIQNKPGLVVARHEVQPPQSTKCRAQLSTLCSRPIIHSPLPQHDADQATIQVQGRRPTAMRYLALARLARARVAILSYIGRREASAVGPAKISVNMRFYKSNGAPGRLRYDVVQNRAKLLRHGRRHIVQPGVVDSDLAGIPSSLRQRTLARERRAWLPKPLAVAFLQIVPIGSVLSRSFDASWGRCFSRTPGRFTRR